MLNKIYNMDCLEGMRDIPDNSIDLVLTDPPYGINKKGIPNDDNLNQYYNALPEMYRVSKEDSFFLTFASIEQIDKFFKNNPFEYVWQYIFYINNGMVRSNIGFSVYIPILIFKKGNPKMQKQIKDVMEISTSSQECSKRQHPTQKDIRLCRKLILAFSKENDTVLDPFIGSGTTALACILTKRNYIGYEIDKNYYDIAEKRIKEYTAQRRL